mmetsp:Transcript_63804/g.152168  ORF Transcript_63804/g.152168 Transcript_63804/m.152168 type:complete len:260 (+) Transcript_63804:1708-2487(+)
MLILLLEYVMLRAPHPIPPDVLIGREIRKGVLLLPLCVKLDLAGLGVVRREAGTLPVIEHVLLGCPRTLPFVLRVVSVGHDVLLLRHLLPPDVRRVIGVRHHVLFRGARTLPHVLRIVSIGHDVLLLRHRLPPYMRRVILVLVEPLLHPRSLPRVNRAVFVLIVVEVLLRLLFAERDLARLGVVRHVRALPVVHHVLLRRARSLPHVPLHLQVVEWACLRLVLPPHDLAQRGVIPVHSKLLGAGWPRGATSRGGPSLGV